MTYKGYTITHAWDWYLVTGNGEVWTEDSVQDAKRTIDEMEKEEENASVSD